MKKFATSTVIAGGLFAGLLGAAGTAHATTTEIVTAPLPSAEVTLPFDTHVEMGPNGATASLPLGLGQASISPRGAHH